MTGPLNDRLEDITRRLLAGYDADDQTHRIGEDFLPSRSKIVQLLSDLRMLLFPGFFGRKKLVRENMDVHAGRLLADLAADLSEEIYHCYCAEQRCGECHDTVPCRQKAVGITTEFLERLPDIREKLALDAQAAYDGDPAAKCIAEVIYCYPGFYAVTVYRIAHALHILEVPLMPRIMSEHAHETTGTDIHPGAQIGKSFFRPVSTGKW